MKTKKLILGITGGIASGKTTVMKMLADAGLPTLCSDDLAHACIRRGTPAYRAILARFGSGILGGDRQIDRKKLGRIVFNDPLQRRQLERIVHPCVIRGLRQFIKRHRGVMALDIPLLYEAGYEDLVNSVIVVYSTRTQQLKRLMRRSGMSRSEASRRVASQLPIEEKCRRANLVLDNSRTLESLRDQVQKLLKELKRS